MGIVYENEQPVERVILVGISERNGDDTESSLAELAELAATAGAEVVGTVIQNLEHMHPGTYVGTGKLEEIRDMIWEKEATGIICDDELSPIQMRNMEQVLDSKVMDNQGYEGQMSLLEDDFYQKYEQKIQLLTEKFMPPREEDASGLEKRRQEMERYADYRNYLTFSMYEKVENPDGSIRKNPVDEMAGRDSGGEGQNPKYVALLAGFAMLYMQQSSRDSKVRLVLLDEAFSKMDKERSEVCLRYARELELQLIVCVPDERLQSLIRNVDCVYGFRRYHNQISMMHIDKGSYLEMIAGGKEDGDEAGADETEDTVIE